MLIRSSCYLAPDRSSRSSLQTSNWYKLESPFFFPPGLTGDFYFLYNEIFWLLIYSSSGQRFGALGFHKLNSALFRFFPKNSDSVLSFWPLFKHKCTLRQMEFQQFSGRTLCQQGKICSHGFQLMPFFAINCCQLSLSWLNKFVVSYCTGYCVGQPRTQTRSVAVEMIRLEIYLRGWLHKTFRRNECELLVQQRYY